jgi:uncharacterized protein (DUF488 family)
MSKAKPPLYTIGYEQAKSAAVLGELAAAKVELLVDVRAVAASRRPGFSKRQLAAGLDEQGIGYLHLRALGTPKPGRHAAKKGDRATLERVYAGQLELPEAQAEAAALEAMVNDKPTALLCFERDPAMCHRTLLIAAAMPQAEVTDLFAG